MFQCSTPLLNRLPRLNNCIFLFFKVAQQVPFRKADDIDDILMEYDYPITEKVEFFKLINVSR